MRLDSHFATTHFRSISIEMKEMKLEGGYMQAHLKEPGVRDLLKGKVSLFGPAVVLASGGQKPGLLRPSLLKQKMGIGYLENEDNEFFAEAGSLHKIALLLRFAFCSVFGLLSLRAAPAEQQQIFGVRYSAISMSAAVDRIASACARHRNVSMHTVAFVNPDCLNKAYEDREYHFLLGQMDSVLPDGSGIRLASRLLGQGLKDNINGTDLFPVLCKRAAKDGLRLFLLGGKETVAARTAENMRDRFPELQIVGTADGYRDIHDSTLIERINQTKPDIVLVGLGAPHQEDWILQNRDFLTAKVGIGVGGLFDYYSGNIKRAPVWIREIGLEWIWRILEEPAAKWRRYILGNPLFLLRVLKEKRDRRGKNVDHMYLPKAPQQVFLDASASADESYKDVIKSWRKGLRFRTINKRALDILIAGSTVVILSPLLLLTAVLLRIESRGPVLFAQERIGARGKPFTMYKFRSMYMDAEERLKELQSQNESAGGVLFKMKQDPRITRVGKVIRRLSIDELPQIFNILKGDMSIVGPRPALASEVVKYSMAERKRLQCKPGLTCLWQIGGRSDLSFNQQVELDISYLKSQSVGKDIEIIAKTVPAVLGGKGAY